MGEEAGPRTIISGLVNYIPIEQMQDKYLIVVVSIPKYGVISGSDVGSFRPTSSQWPCEESRALGWYSAYVEPSYQVVPVLISLAASCIRLPQKVAKKAVSRSWIRRKDPNQVIGSTLRESNMKVCDFCFALFSFVVRSSLVLLRRRRAATIIEPQEEDIRNHSAW